MTTKGLILTCSLLLILGTLALTTNAQQRCLNRAVGVPFLSGPPNWWDSAPGPPQFQPVDDDPRWQGALADTFNNGAGEEASTRALYDVEAGQKYLYLSFNSKLDSMSPSNHHRVYLGLSDPTGTSAVVIRFNLTTVAPTSTPDVAVTDVNVRMFQRSGAGWAAISPVPSWIDISGPTRVWIKSNNWSVHVRIPLTNTANLNNGVNVGTGPTFLYWYTIMRGTPTGAGLPFFNIKRGPFQFSNDTNAAADFPAPDATEWQETRFGVFNSFDPPDPNCLNEGISLHYMDIGTTNPVSTEIKWKIPAGSTTRPTNTFFVRPRFNVSNPAAMPTPIPIGGLTARFRMANWGSQPDPNDIPNLADLWKDVPNGAAVSNDVPIPIASPTPPAGSHLPYPAPTPPAGPAAPIHFDWQLSNAEAADFTGPNPAKWTHQCFLVEFQGGGVSFYNKSAWNNLNFEDASVMKRDAQISVVGLQPITGTTRRDVYLLLETLNMPPVPRKNDNIAGAGQKKSAQHFNTRGMTGAGMTTKEMDKIMPTYRVYAYHDTGTTLTTDGGTVLRLLRPQGSFGYYVRHDGDVEGWKHQLDGAVQLAPNLYLIKVPNNGSAKVTTTIEAVEPDNDNFKRWGLSLHAGASFPHGSFSSIFNPGPNVAVDLEYRLTPIFSLEGIYGFHRFNGATIGPFTFGDLNVHQISLNGKVYGTSSPVRPFFNFGGGAYNFSPGTHGGLNVGAGLQFDVTPNFAVEGVYNFHNVFTSGANTRFSGVQGGVRFRF